MTQTSNQLLGNIFQILTKIEKKLDNGSGGTSTQSNATSNGIVNGVTKGGFNIFNKSNKSGSIVNSGVSMIPELTKATKGFSKNKDIKSYITFLGDLTEIAERADNISSKDSINGMLLNSFKDSALLSKNIGVFNKLHSSGAIKLALKGLDGLVKGYTSIANKISDSDTSKLTNMSEYIVKPFESISNALIKFGTSMLIMGATFVIANSLLGFGGTVGAFVGTLAGVAITLLTFVGTLALMNKFMPDSEEGFKGLESVSNSLLGFTGSLLLMGAGFLILDKLSGGNGTGVFFTAIGAISVSLLLMCGTMALIGKLGGITMRGMKVMQGIGIGLITFTASIVLMAASMLLINAISDNPFATAGVFLGGFLMVAGGMMIMAGTMALIGSIRPLTDKGTTSLAGMGMSVLALSASLIIAAGLLYGSTYVDLGEHKTTPLFIGASLLAMAGIFATIGLMSAPIKKAAGAVGLMSLSILGFGISLAATAFMFQKVFDVSKGWGSVATGAIGILAVVGGIVGMAALYSSVIAPMSPLVLVASAAVGAMALSIGGVILAMGAACKVATMIPDDFGTTLRKGIGGFISGVWMGFVDGFGFKVDGNIGVSALKSAAKVVAMGVASAMLMGLSVAVVQFAKAMSYFGSGGNITIYKQDKDGNFISGPTVDTVAAAVSAGTAIRSFLNEISSATKGLDFEKTKKIAELLLGSSSASFLGIKINPKPGLLDATMKFADMLDKFAGEKNTFKVYDEKTKKYVSVPMTTISRNIGESIVTFYNTIIDNVKQLDTPEQYKKVEDMAALLMGKSGMLSIGWTGVKFEGSKIGILEPVIKFAEIVKLLGNNKYKDEKGVEHEINMDGAAIAQKIINFTDTLMKGLENAELGSDVSSQGFNKFTGFIDNLGAKTEVIDKVAESIDKLAESTAKLVASINELNVNKLNAISSGKGGSYKDSTPSPVVSASHNAIPSSNNKGGNSDNSDVVANKVMSMLSTKTFVFEFTNNNGGKLIFR